MLPKSSGSEYPRERTTQHGLQGVGGRFGLFFLKKKVRTHGWAAARYLTKFSMAV
eukprot:SAG31_NODE_765_length_12248_cov_6.802947_1_plen_55_part_10